MSIIKKNQNLQKKVESLLRENKNLRKKLSKLRKVTSTNVSYSENKSEKLEIKDRDTYKECPYCRGEIKKVSILNLKFEVCQNCKTRTKLK